MSGVITDTPTYEKNGWAGDAQLSVPARVAVVRHRAPLREVRAGHGRRPARVRRGAAALAGLGQLRLRGRARRSSRPTRKATPIWDACWFVIPWETYLRYGDREDARAQLPGHEGLPARRGCRSGSRPTATATTTRSTRASATGCVPTGATRRSAPPTRVAGPDRHRRRPSTAYVAYMAKIAADSARALGKPTRPRSTTRSTTASRPTSTPSGGTRASATTARTPTQIFVQTMQMLRAGVRAGAAGAAARAAGEARQRRAGHPRRASDDRHRRLALDLPGAARRPPTRACRTRPRPRTRSRSRRRTRATATGPSTLGWTSLGEYWEQSSRTRNHHMFGTIGQWFYEELAGHQAARAGLRADRDQAADRARTRASTRVGVLRLASAARSSRAGSRPAAGIRWT